MSTLPRPTGKELVRALVSLQSVPVEATAFFGIPTAGRRSFPCVAALWVGGC
jgi:hypothetical protein